ncbi:hypothetical protein C2R22_15195 [Salinigranum rubrum]|uniref:Uncharacterized protein n=1 Tax=Salinigranum rubrum TaxID=755307 RepID=A0A2I8VLK5_9EURY|nr:hypothetical protein [Salinigranum rubrum]AUV82817.1 hypothetical protein C2R22_15195 [Salinigranum rubrum]
MQFALPPLTDLAAFGFLTLVVLAVTGFVGALLYLDHRQTMALIASGQYADAKRDGRAWVLAAGLVLVAIGVGQAAESVAAGMPPEGLTLALVGVAALVYYVVRRRERPSDVIDA